MSVILLLVTVTLGYFCFNRTASDPVFYNMFVFFCLFILFTVFLLGTIAYIKEFLSSQFRSDKFYLFSTSKKTMDIHVHRFVAHHKISEETELYSYNGVKIDTPILEISTDNFFRRIHYCLLNTTPDRIYWRFKLSGNCIELRNSSRAEERLRLPYPDAIYFVSYFESFTELLAMCNKLAEIEQTLGELKNAQTKNNEKISKLRKELARKKKKFDALKLKVEKNAAALNS